MTLDFWLQLLCTVLITLVVIGVDYISGKLVTDRRYLAAIQKATNDTSLRPAQLKENIQNLMTQWRSQQVISQSWGADLASVAFSLDFSVLFLWISNPTAFPFFQKFTTYAVPIWITVILVHLCLLVLAVVIKNIHLGKTEMDPEYSQGNLTIKLWLLQNSWMLMGNAIGFIAVFSSLLIISDAIKF